MPVGNGAETPSRPIARNKRPYRETEPHRLDGVDSDASNASSSGESHNVYSRDERLATTSRAKIRRPAYSTLRRQERDTLAKEVKLLETQADLLRERAGLASVTAAESVKRTEHENRLLEDARRAQLLALCGMRSEISRNLREQFGVPLNVPIRLGADLRERRSTLLALRRVKLNRAYDFLNERFRGVDIASRHRETEYWTTAEGDFCGISSHLVHFQGVRSVKQVYDAFMFYMVNMEIEISEALGHLTLREDIDSVDTSISNHRLVSTTDHGLVLETNAANFGEYYERFPDHRDEEFALFAADFVEDDALHPYRSQERVRKDITGVVSMSPLRKTQPGDELVVVMRRAAYLRIWRPQFPVSEAQLDDLEANVGSWGDVMLQSMRATLSASS